MSETLETPDQAPALRPGPGRPPTGARGRILEAGYRVLARDGYAGLTMAKVAAEADQNQALIGYHFGGKQGLVTAVARRVADRIIGEVLPTVERAETAEALARDALDGLWALMERDEGIQRVYFDLASQSIVDPEIQALMSDVKATFRAILGERLGRLDPSRDASETEAAAVFVLAGIEGLALQRLDRGETGSIASARRIWVGSVGAALDGA